MHNSEGEAPVLWPPDATPIQKPRTNSLVCQGSPPVSGLVWGKLSQGLETHDHRQV